MALRGRYRDDNLGPVARPRQETMTKQEMGYLGVERMCMSVQSTGTGLYSDTSSEVKTKLR